MDMRMITDGSVSLPHAGMGECREWLIVTWIVRGHASDPDAHEL